MRLTGLLLILSLAAGLFAAQITTLTITDRAGVARVKEPILMGVPLPENMTLTDTTKFTLRDQSNVIIPCEFRSATRWLKNRNAIRFLHLDFQTDLTASQTKTVTLNTESSPYRASTNLTVVDNGTTFTVNTGVLRFIVRKARFNLIDQAWIDETGSQNYNSGNQIIATHNNGLTHKRLTVEYTSANDAASTVVIERQGPMSVVLKAMGACKNVAGDSSLHFVTRLYAYAGSKLVRIENTVEYHNTIMQACTYFTDIKATLPLTLTAKNALIAKAGGSDAVTLTGTQVAYTFSRLKSGSTLGGVDVVNGGQAPALTVNPVLTKPRDLGWASLSDGSKGVAAGFNWFWEMYPQGMEVDGAGNLIIKFYTERSANTLQVFSGISRTQEVRLVFFNDDAAADQRAQVIGVSNRLYAVAPVDWYCHKTYALGRLVPPRASLYASSDWTVVQNADTKFNAHWTAVRNEVSSRFGLDTYGYLNYGDGLHYLWGDASNLWNRSYDGNYYDLPHMAFQSFARTGDATFLEHGAVNANHIEDVHQGHFGPTSTTGGCRYCPATNHCSSDAPSNDSANVHTESHTSHHKSQSMFENWLLLGDRRSLETSVESWDWLGQFGIAAGQGDDINVYCRRAAHMIHSLTYAYYHTKKAKYFIQLMGLWDNLQNWISGGGVIGQTFMWGFLMEGMVDYYYMLGDEPIAPTYGDSLDMLDQVFFQTYSPSSTQENVLLWTEVWVGDANRIQYGYANTAVAYGFIAKHSDPNMRVNCVNKVNAFQATPYSNTNKDFALHGRSIHRALYYLAKPDSVNLSTTTADAPVAAASQGPLALDASPNPCNPSTVIRLRGAVANPAAPAELSVYDVRGALVQRMNMDMRTLSKGYVWDGTAMPSGVYMAKVKAGSRVLARKITLMK